ncbi:histone H1-like repetitive region-containing protein [Kitasatospora sp. KL5]|uniref:histone H1-like repetitive region-containing protein n=1 Tax=Kitasatospora sp. KL5 TaxID=3425125 RepID=UPI003D6DFE8C
MLRDAVRGVVVVAAGIAEEAGRRVVGAAVGLLERGGVDVAAVERRIAEQLPPSVQSLQTLANEAVTVGRAGVDLAVGVARSEVERVFERVGDQAVKVGVVLSYLESRLRAVEDEEQPAAGGPAKRGNRADGLFDDGWDDGVDGAPGPEVVFAEPLPEPAAQAPAAEAAEAADAAEGPAAGAEEAATAQKPAAKRAPAKKTSAQPAAARKAAAKKTTAKKTTAKKTTAKKTTTRKATAKRTAAQPSAVKKATAKKTVVKKTVTRRPAPKEDGGA